MEENQEEINLPKKKKRRAKDKRVPLLTSIGFFAPLLFGKAYGGTWKSPVEAAQEGNFMKALQSAIMNLTGIGVSVPGAELPEGITFDLSKVLDPVDFGHAGALKGLLYGSVGSGIATKLGVNRKLRKVPFVGKYIKL